VDQLPHMTQKLMAGDAPWRVFVLTFVGAFFGALGVLYAFFIVVDPYDTGRVFSAFHAPRISDDNKLTATASRARDPQFTAAIFGNSHGQLIDPWRLTDATGLSFVQLTTTGSGPREQLTVMRYFIRYHPHIDAVVLAVDPRWCSLDPTLPVLFPFPFWLYGGDFEYLTHMLSSRSLSDSLRRIRFILGWIPASDMRGAWDYEASRLWNFRPVIPPEVDSVTLAGPLTLPKSFPAIDMLDPVLANLAANTPIVIVMPPQFFTALPRAGTQAGLELQSCKQAFSQRVDGRPRSGFLDFLRDTPVSREPHNFMDAEHYRSNVARDIEAQIEQVLDKSVAQHVPR
jgi:hypothetical protein